MAERKAKRRRRKGENEGELTKEEKAMKSQMEMVAKYLRRNMKCKTAAIKGQNIEFFTGSKVVDALMDSEWGGASRRSTVGTNLPAFPSRESAISYCNKLLEYGFFVRGCRVEVEPKDKDKEKEKEQDNGSSKDREVSPKATRRKKGKGTSKDGESNEKKQGDSEKKDGEDGKKKKKKFKIRFHDHDDQFFEDSSSEIFIWQYSPQGWRGTLIGLGLLTLTVAVTMYPLWPEWTRVGAYALSVGLASLLGLLLLGEFARIVLFAVIWLLTWGRVHFTLLPSLYEDVGFWDSFKPLYKIEYKSSISEEDEEEEEEDETEEKTIQIPEEPSFKSGTKDNGTPEELGTTETTSEQEKEGSSLDQEGSMKGTESGNSEHEQKVPDDS